MRFNADTLNRLKMELERAFDDLDEPGEPQRVFKCATADRPAAADYPFCILFNTTAGALQVSDGVNWV